MDREVDLLADSCHDVRCILRRLRRSPPERSRIRYRSVRRNFDPVSAAKLADFPITCSLAVVRDSEDEKL
jgi:hypothetical protein